MRAVAPVVSDGGSPDAPCFARVEAIRYADGLFLGTFSGDRPRVFSAPAISEIVPGGGYHLDVVRKRRERFEDARGRPRTEDVIEVRSVRAVDRPRVLTAAEEAFLADRPADLLGRALLAEYRFPREVSERQALTLLATSAFPQRRTGGIAAALVCPFNTPDEASRIAQDLLASTSRPPGSADAAALLPHKIGAFHADPVATSWQLACGANPDEAFVSRHLVERIGARTRERSVGVVASRGSVLRILPLLRHSELSLLHDESIRRRSGPGDSLEALETLARRALGARAPRPDRLLGHVASLYQRLPYAEEAGVSRAEMRVILERWREAYARRSVPDPLKPLLGEGLVETVSRIALALARLRNPTPIGFALDRESIADAARLWESNFEETLVLMEASGGAYGLDRKAVADGPNPFKDPRIGHRALLDLLESLAKELRTRRVSRADLYEAALARLFLKRAAVDRELRDLQRAGWVTVRDGEIGIEWGDPK